MTNYWLDEYKSLDDAVENLARYVAPYRGLKFGQGRRTKEGLEEFRNHYVNDRFKNKISIYWHVEFNTKMIRSGNIIVDKRENSVGETVIIWERNPMLDPKLVDGKWHHVTMDNLGNFYVD